MWIADFEKPSPEPAIVIARREIDAIVAWLRHRDQRFITGPSAADMIERREYRRGPEND
jgi:hypothetical protein